MAEFINTIDALGDDVVIDSIIDRTITEFKDDKLTEVGIRAFNSCGALETIDLPKVTVIPGYTFGGCNSLVHYNSIENLTSIGSDAFVGAKFTRLYLPRIRTLVGNLRQLPDLKVVDLPICTDIGGYTFYCDQSLTTLVLRSSTLCTLGNVNAFTGSWAGNTNNPGNHTPISSGTGYIYVPSALIEDYKVATNWSTYAAQFRALEDYTVDGTTTGELDETKI